jgi:hypothetical protein
MIQPLRQRLGGMRGNFEDQGHVFFYIPLGERVPADHPLRKVRELTREVFTAMDKDFRKPYAHEGRVTLASANATSEGIHKWRY